MDYHNDRFEDFSLMIYKEGKLIALIPANIKGTGIYSHGGLTYGGLILKDNTALVDVESIFESTILFLKRNGIVQLEIKTFPNFYASQSSEELVYILNKKKASIVYQNLILAIDLRSDYKIYKSKRKRFKKLEQGGFQINQGFDEFRPFWEKLLEPRLYEKHNTQPVHNLDEITKLSQSFPENIVQYTIYQNNELLAGITVFKTKRAVKSQYGIASKMGEKVGALDILFVYLIKKFKEEGYPFFSMGRINDDDYNNGYNTGMLKQKQEFGCEIYLQPVYQLDLNG